MLFNNFFQLSIHALVAKTGKTKLCDGAHRRRIFGDFLRPVFSASRLQHVTDLHSKFALGPHHDRSMVDIQTATAENRRGKKEEDRRIYKKKKPQDKNIMACPFHRAAIIKWKHWDGAYLRQGTSCQCRHLVNQYEQHIYVR